LSYAFCPISISPHRTNLQVSLEEKNPLKALIEVGEFKKRGSLIEICGGNLFSNNLNLHSINISNYLYINFSVSNFDSNQRFTAQI